MDDTQFPNDTLAHALPTAEASRFKLTINAKGAMQYEVSFGYTTVREMLMHMVADATAFDRAIRVTFPSVVPAAAPSASVPANVPLPHGYADE